MRKAVELICRKVKEFGGEKKELAIKFDGQSTEVTPKIRNMNELLEDTRAMARIWDLYGDLLKGA